MEIRNESMRHIGMSRDSIKEAVLQKLDIGQQYRLKSVNATPNDNPADAKCRLIELSKNAAVFLHKNGTTESFAYQDLWKQMIDGTFV